MAAYRERQTNTDEIRRLRNQEYIDGNTVLKPAYKPEQTPKTDERPEQSPRHQVDRRPLVGFKREMDFINLCVIGAAMAVIMVLAIQYLKVSAQVTETNKAITNLTKEYETIHGENDAKLVDIADNINLNEVYEIAVGKLGMVYPNHNQVIEFQCAGDGYVRRYSNIPDAADEGDVDALTEVLRHLLQ